MSLSNTLLQSGCAPHSHAAHSEMIEVMKGLDAGKKFSAVVEVDADAMLAVEMLGNKDRRARKQMRFMGDVPSLPPNTQVKTEDGKTWYVVDAPQNGFLSTDFQILEIVAGKDQ